MVHLWNMVNITKNREDVDEISCLIMFYNVYKRYILKSIPFDEIVREKLLKIKISIFVIMQHAN